jgi:hypothetical protein
MKKTLMMYAETRRAIGWQTFLVRNSATSVHMVGNVLSGSPILHIRHFPKCLDYLFKWTVAPVWVWLKVVWLETAKIGEELLSIFNIFKSLFDF